MISYQNDRKYSTAAQQGGEIVREYSNAWIGMRHDNALNSAEPDVRLLVSRAPRCNLWEAG